jgi:hypothetical protein
VVDIDTLWTRLEDGKDFYWEGSTCKIFTSRLLMARMENDWIYTHRIVIALLMYILSWFLNGFMVTTKWHRLECP